MTTQDKLVLAQTIILFLTGLVVAWYTVETARIRRGTIRQAELLAEQLQMLRAQVERDRAQGDREEQRLELEAQPQFRYRGGSQDSSRSIFELMNLGTAPIRDLTVDVKGFQASVSPTAFVGPNETVRVTIVALTRPTPKFAFALEYTDKYGKRRRRLFEHSGSDGGEIRDHDVSV